jgi:hypothetical protein
MREDWEELFGPEPFPPANNAPALISLSATYSQASEPNGAFYRSCMAEDRSKFDLTAKVKRQSLG